MEILEEMFKSVILDSQKEENKIGIINENTILDGLLPYVRGMIEKIVISSSDDYVISELLKFIRLAKRYKPGYVIKDLKNIFDLGSVEYEFNFTDRPEKMEPIINFSATQLFEKWFRVYGMRKHKHLDHAENKLFITNRNECITLALKSDKKNYFDFNNINYSSLSKIKQKNGIEYMKKNFQNIISLLKGETSIGIKVEDLPTTNEPDPSYPENPTK